MIKALHSLAQRVRKFRQAKLGHAINPPPCAKKIIRVITGSISLLFLFNPYFIFGILKGAIILTLTG